MTASADASDVACVTGDVVVERESGRFARAADPRAVGGSPARDGREDGAAERVAAAEAASGRGVADAPTGLCAGGRARAVGPDAVRAAAHGRAARRAGACGAAV